MTVYTLQAPMPELSLASGMIIRLEAVSPTTGAAITGVTASAWAIYGEDISGTIGELTDIVPRLSKEEVPGESG